MNYVENGFGEHFTYGAPTMTDNRFVEIRVYLAVAVKGQKRSCDNDRVSEDPMVNLFKNCVDSIAKLAFSVAS